jgi:hypothetical protein
LAKKGGFLKAVENLSLEEIRSDKFKTLEIRARELKTAESRNLLEKLSVAAETIGDFAQAIEFEKANSKFRSSPEAAKISEIRIESLQKMLDEVVAQQSNFSIVNEKPTAVF